MRCVGIRRRLLLAALVGVLGMGRGGGGGVIAQELEGTAASSKQPSLFRRVTQAIQSTLQGSANTLAGLVGGEQGEAAAPLQDTWATSPGLGIVRRLLDGDHLGVVFDMVHNKELDEMWSDPAVAGRLLQNFPMLSGIRGVPEIMAKAANEGLAPEDGLSVLNSLRQMAAAFVARSGDLADPDKMANLFASYAERIETDPALKALVENVQAGDKEAAYDLQQLVADDAWGGLVDLRAFGLDGTVPEQLLKSRDIVVNEEPSVFELMHGGDEFVKGLMLDPSAATRIVQETVDKAMAAAAAAEST